MDRQVVYDQVLAMVERHEDWYAQTRGYDTGIPGRADFSNLDLSGINLSGRTLAGAQFVGTNLAGSDLSNATISRTVFENTDLHNANLEGAGLKRSAFVECDMQGVNLRGAWLEEAVFEDSNLSRASLENAVEFLTGFGGSTLDHADLRMIDLSGNWVTSIDGHEVDDESLDVVSLDGARFGHEDVPPISRLPWTTHAAAAARTLKEPVDLSALPIFQPGSNEIVDVRETFTLALDQKMNVLGRSEDGERVFGRDGGSVLSVSRDVFTEAPPHLDEVVTITRIDGKDQALSQSQEVDLER